MNANVLHAARENAADVLVEKAHERVAWLDERDRDAKLGKNARVFATDDASSNNDEGARHGLEFKNSVGIDDRGMREIDLFGTRRR